MAPPDSVDRDITATEPNQSGGTGVTYVPKPGRDDEWLWPG